MGHGAMGFFYDLIFIEGGLFELTLFMILLDPIEIN